MGQRRCKQPLSYPHEVEQNQYYSDLSHGNSFSRHHALLELNQGRQARVSYPATTLSHHAGRIAPEWWPDQFSHAEVKAWATRSLVSATTVVSDSLWCFQSVTQAGCTQQREVVGKGRKSTDMECFSWVNTILGNLKNAINGTYHAFDFEKYAHRYLGEYQYRFNRRFDLAALLPRMTIAAAATGRRPEHWLRLAEDQFLSGKTNNGPTGHFQKSERLALAANPSLF